MPMILVNPIKVPANATAQNILNIINLGLLLRFLFANLSTLNRAMNCEVKILRNIAVKVIQLLLIPIIGIGYTPAALLYMDVRLIRTKSAIMKVAAKQLIMICFVVHLFCALFIIGPNKQTFIAALNNAQGRTLTLITFNSGELDKLRFVK